MDKQHTARQPEQCCCCNGQIEQHETKPAEHGSRNQEVHRDTVPIEENIGFGYADIKEEGAPVNPDELIYLCDCKKCKAHYKRQKKAYLDYQMRRRRS